MKKIIIPVLSLFLIFSCDMLPSPDKEKDEPTKFENILNSYSNVLTNDLNEEQRKTLLTNATAAAGEVTSEKPEEIIPLAVESLITSLEKDTSLTSDTRINVINIISKESVTIINDQITTESRSSRAVDVSLLKTLLTEVARSIVKSVPKSGVSKQEYTKANQESLENLVSSLDETGAQTNEIVELAGSVTESAVSQLKASDTDYADVKSEVVKSISQGAIQGISEITTTDINKVDLVQSVTEAALKAVSELDADVQEVSILIIVVTDGTTAGINTIQSDLNTTELSEAIKAVSKETVESIGSLNISNEEKKEKLTQLSSEINEKVTVNISEIDSSEALKAVVSGIATGAQEISTDFGKIDTILETIDIKDEAGNKIELGDFKEDIQAGIDQGQEEVQAKADETEKLFLAALIKANNITADSTVEEISAEIESLEELVKNYPDHKLVADVEIKVTILNNQKIDRLFLNAITEADKINEDSTLEDISANITILEELITNNPSHYQEDQILLKLTVFYRQRFNINNTRDSKDPDLLKAIEYATKLIGDYSSPSLYVYEASLILVEIYKMDTKEFDKAIDVINNIETNFSEDSLKVIRAHYEVMMTYREKWFFYRDEWKNIGTHIEFLENTYIPSIDSVLTDIDGVIGYDHEYYWILTSTIQRKANSYFWLEDFQASTGYLNSEIDKLAGLTLTVDQENLAKANLFTTLGQMFVERVWQTGLDRDYNIQAAITALIEAERLTWNGGNILDEWLYVNGATNLLTAIELKSQHTENIKAEDIPQEFFHLIDILNEVSPRLKNLGDDKSGQHGRIVSYMREGRLFNNLARMYRGFNEELSTRYYERSLQVLTEAFTAYKNNEYFFIDEWAVSEIFSTMFNATFDLKGMDEALALLDNDLDTFQYSQFGYGDIFHKLYSELNYFMILANFNNYPLEEINKQKTIADTFYSRTLTLVRENKYQWYANNTTSFVCSFYYGYFKYVLTLNNTANNDSLTDARLKAIEIGPGYSEDIEWFKELFESQYDQFGGSKELDLKGDVNVIIK